MASFLNYPTYVLSNEKKAKLSFIKKIYFVFVSLLIIFIEKKINGKFYTLAINTVLRRKVKLDFVNNKYTANENGKTFYYSNKRVTRMLNGIDEMSEKLFNQYCLDKITFKSGDLIVDCGANTGELYIHLEKLVPELEYIAFEPDKEVYDCLRMNIPNTKTTLNRVALSSTTGEKKFYIASQNADSSLENQGSTQSEIIKVTKLDDVGLSNIKLLKIDSEGHELEALIGATNTLKQIEYISVDFGPEKGIKQKKTLPEVSSFLYENNFKMIHVNSDRDIGLFLNKTNL